MAKNYCPAHTQLILDDNYIERVKAYFKATACDAERKLDILIAALSNVCEGGAISGETADVLKQYLDRVSALSGMILKYGTECSNFAQDFLNTIDEIDEKLYR